MKHHQSRKMKLLNDEYECPLSEVQLITCPPPFQKSRELDPKKKTIRRNTPNWWKKMHVLEIQKSKWEERQPHIKYIKQSVITENILNHEASIIYALNATNSDSDKFQLHACFNYINHSHVSQADLIIFFTSNVMLSMNDGSRSPQGKKHITLKSLALYL